MFGNAILLICNTVISILDKEHENKKSIYCNQNMTDANIVNANIFIRPESFFYLLFFLSISLTVLLTYRRKCTYGERASERADRCD